ncbi:P-loop containing nucleoside triphosphate hydrolase, partial [Trinorchestia longiramus]
VQWCKPKDQDCYSPAVLCRDMDEDLETFKMLKELYPNRIQLLRYEDFMNDAVSKAQVITEWVGMNFTSSMKSFITKNTNTEINKPWTISRKSKEHLLHWTRTLSLGDLHEIQDSCARTMEKFGYKTVNSLQNLSAEDVFQDI